MSEPSESEKATARTMLREKCRHGIGPWCGDCIAQALAARGDEERERAAKVVEARGKKVGGAIDPALTAAAIRDGGRDGK